MWPVVSAQMLPRFQLIFPSKTWFLEFIWNFSGKHYLKNQYLSHFESKSYQINSINPAHQGLSNNTKGTFQFLWNFQLQFNLIFSEEIIQYSKTSTPQEQTPWNQANAPPSSSRKTKNAIWSNPVWWIS